ncbi:MAG: hypothetical protein JWQ79_1490 [Mucilaginibacter sp.]|jgi:histone arginine demethylase JMJD6|nr:hypothetical protein [Mucilaginibacter sp.]
METVKSIEKRDEISYQEFVDEYLKKRIPVVFKNATSAWKSNTIFTPEFFREKFGNHKSWLDGVEYTMAEILEITANSTPENPAPYPIFFEVAKQIPELMEMFQPIDMNFSYPNWFRSNILPYGKFGNNIQLFIGGKGNQYRLHKDLYHTNAWITQLYGEKKFVIFYGEEQDEYLYAGKDEFFSPINIAAPDYEKYPKYKNATPLEVTLQPGETIFIPNGVWHTTIAYGHNISLIYDQLNGTNFSAWKKDLYDFTKNQGTLKAMAIYAWAVSVGAVCKLAALTGKKF